LEAKPDASGIKETVEPISSKSKKAPKFYKYGDPDDYQLNQAIAYLKKEDAKKNQPAAGTQERKLRCPDTCQYAGCPYSGALAEICEKGRLRRRR